MQKTLKMSDIPLHTFKFVLKTLTESKPIKVTAAEFETAAEAARAEAEKQGAALAYAGVEAG